MTTTLRRTTGALLIGSALASRPAASVLSDTSTGRHPARAADVVLPPSWRVGDCRDMVRHGLTYALLAVPSCAAGRAAAGRNGLRSPPGRSRIGAVPGRFRRWVSSALLAQAYVDGDSSTRTRSRRPGWPAPVRRPLLASTGHSAVACRRLTWSYLRRTGADAAMGADGCGQRALTANQGDGGHRRAGLPSGPGRVVGQHSWRACGWHRVGCRVRGSGCAGSRFARRPGA